MNAIERTIRAKFDQFGEWRRGDNNLLGYALILPAIVTFLLLSVGPIAYGIWLSFHSGFGLLNLEFVGLRNYSRLITNDPVFWSSVRTGFVYAIYSIVLQTVAGVGIALLLNRSFRAQNLVRTIVLLPYLIPTVAVGIIFRWILNNQVGLLNYYLLEYFHADGPISFFAEGLALHTVVWASGWKFTIFVVLIVLARLQSIDPELYELAKINGAGAVNRFFDVTLPHIRSALYLVILLRGIFMFNKFDMIWILTEGGPFNETQTMVIYAYEKSFAELNYGEGAAITTMMFAILAIVATVYFYKFSPEEEVAM